MGEKIEIIFLTYFLELIMSKVNMEYKQKSKFSNNTYKNKVRTSRPSYGIFCYIFSDNIDREKAKNETKYLMVMRRNSYAYEEFIRGSYDINDLNYIRDLISRLTKDEANKIINSEFDDLWSDLNKAYTITTTDPTKLRLAKENFYKIKENRNLYNLSEDEIEWTEPEWCFPKGKKNNILESEIDCAKREFWEETKIRENEYNLKSIVPIEVKYIADNGVPYENTYYFAEMKNYRDIIIDDRDESQKAEIGKIEFLTKNECNMKIRSYHKYITEIFDKGSEVCDQLFYHNNRKSY